MQSVTISIFSQYIFAQNHEKHVPSIRIIRKRTIGSVIMAVGSYESSVFVLTCCVDILQKCIFYYKLKQTLEKSFNTFGYFIVHVVFQFFIGGI